MSQPRRCAGEGNRWSSTTVERKLSGRRIFESRHVIQRERPQPLPGMSTPDPPVDGDRGSLTAALVSTVRVQLPWWTRSYPSHPRTRARWPRRQFEPIFRRAGTPGWGARSGQDAKLHGQAERIRPAPVLGLPAVLDPEQVDSVGGGLLPGRGDAEELALAAEIPAHGRCGLADARCRSTVH